MNINPFINLINSILSMYSFILVAWMILGWLIRFEIVNRYNKLVVNLMNFGARLFEPVFSQIRKVIPPISGIDFSPIILFLLINFTKDFLFTYFYSI